MLGVERKSQKVSAEKAYTIMREEVDPCTGLRKFDITELLSVKQITSWFSRRYKKSKDTSEKAKQSLSLSSSSSANTSSPFSLLTKRKPVSQMNGTFFFVSINCFFVWRYGDIFLVWSPIPNDFFLHQKMNKKTRKTSSSPSSDRVTYISVVNAAKLVTTPARVRRVHKSSFRLSTY